MRSALRAVLLTLILAAGAAAGLPARALTPDPAARVKLATCELEHPLGLARISAECARLIVPENPASPGGRRIGLYVARVAAVSRLKRPDPLFVLAGGPGQAATSFYTTVAPAFARIRRERDIVLLDQRGTGQSHPLDCPDSDDSPQHPSPAQIAAATRACLARLTRSAAPAYYTTHFAVGDLEQVRAALGYERINLYGVSYGTRVAQQYLRRYPQRVRTVILDGVVAPQVAVGADTPVTGENALTDILARCTGEPACRERFGDPQRDYRAVRAVLAGRAQPVSLPDPASGQGRHFAFGPAQLAAVLRLSSYSPEAAALLPRMLHAAAQGDYAPLAGQFLLLQRSYGDQVAAGMHNSVACAEDVPFYPLAPDRERLARTFLGSTQIEGLELVCRLWPHGAVDPDLHAPLHSDVPALLLSGSDDPVTPRAWAQQAAQGFSVHRELVLQGFGHGQLTAPCMDQVLAQFVDRAALDLDTACLAAARPMPFFLSVNGPGP